MPPKEAPAPVLNPPPILSNDGKQSAVVLIMIGMAGSGKTTLMQRLCSHLHSQKEPMYVVNLDPAVNSLSYNANIDIRDTVNYKEVMKQYNLGPNGGIVTALNLFTTKFDQVMDYMEKRAPQLKYILFDTPGQIEIFTWSASGAIITDALASTYPCVVVYVVDTPRTSNPVTFMSNMLYACSILYKTKLPFVLAFNKTDVLKHDFAVEWMRDFESFHQALSEESATYMTDMIYSMSLVLDEFYKQLRAVGVSAVTGEGMTEFFEAVGEAVKEYETEYVPELRRMMELKREKDEAKRANDLDRLMKDLSVDAKLAPKVDKFDDEVEGEEDDDEVQDTAGYEDPENDRGRANLEEESFQRFLATQGLPAGPK